ncbi:MAG: integrin alpha [Thiogranum sp.]
MKKSLTIFWTLILFLLLTGARCSDSTVTTEVDSEEKISDSKGGFDGNLDDGDQFGSAIASIGDLESDGVSDLAVGAPFDDDNGENRGAVWILFMDDDGRVDLEQKISDDEGGFNGNLDNNDRFGSAIASIGDINGDGVIDLAAGAPGDDDGGDDQGAVWILLLDTLGRVVQNLKISDRVGGFDGNLSDGDQFGGAVANIGDVDIDGVTDLAVGARRDDDGGNNKGAVWILFMNSDGSIKALQKISANEGNFDGNLDNDDHFGSAVAGIGDLNGDGVNDLAVGASQDSDGGSNRGALWILFLNTDGTVSSNQKISQNDGEFNGDLNDGDRFGSAVANIGDLDDDGIIDLAVGAPQNDDGGQDRGATWILFMDDNGEVGSESIISSGNNFDGNLSDGDQFGSAVASIGDLDGDGINDITIGAPLDNDGGTDRGAVWVLFMKRAETDFNLFGQ